MWLLRGLGGFGVPPGCGKLGTFGFSLGILGWFCFLSCATDVWFG